MLMRAAMLFLGVFGAAGCWCCGSLHVRGSPPTPPDEQYQTGTTHGLDIIVWHCLNGRHIVVTRYSGEGICSPAELETTACGTPTKVEVETAGEARKPVSLW